MRGFTLIELLVVISIIAIISMVGLVSYTNFLKSSRDSKRQADLKFIQSALEEYHADQIFYPGSITFTAGSRITNATGITPAPSVTKTYMGTVPTDPTGTNQYRYQSYKCSSASCATYVACGNGDNVPASTTKCVKYCLFASIEGTVIPTSDSACSATSIPDYPSGYNYSLSKP